MDFAKAFDKVPHKRLLSKLNYYGIEYNTLKGIEDLLTQAGIIDGVQSEKNHVTSGIPQLTLLSPILFLVYINDFSEYIQHSTRLFADDSIIYKTIRNKEDTQKLQEDLTSAAKWEKD